MADPSATRTVPLTSGASMAALGQGTWRMAEDHMRRRDEIAALKTGLDLGLTVIDTAEMYAGGAAEELVGVAIAGRRDEVFLVSKALPSHASAADIVAACHRSLRRLRTDRLDLYLLHWRGNVPLADTVAGFEALVRAGAILHWGVSNFDVPDLDELANEPGGAGVEVNQVLYNLSRRGPEFDLLPWCEQRGVATMAYSPVEEGRLLTHRVVRDIATRHEATAAQIALAWILRRPGVNAVPKAGSLAHVRDNHAALGITLSEQDHRDLDRAFPPPNRKQPLAMS